MVTFGALISGPTNHYWYAVLERLTPGVSTTATVTKTLLDQVVFAPFILSCFFGSISKFEKDDVCAHNQIFDLLLARSLDSDDGGQVGRRCQECH
jgi:hypothetical protein